MTRNDVAFHVRIRFADWLRGLAARVVYALKRPEPWAGPTRDELIVREISQLRDAAHHRQAVTDLIESNYRPTEETA